MQPNTLFVGIDLGSFKSSIVASNGTQEVTYSAVGWPKDYVARSVLGQDLIIGKDVLENRLALDIVRPFEKGGIKYETAGLRAEGAAGRSGSPENHLAGHAVGTDTAADRPGQSERSLQAAKLLVKHVVSLTRAPKDAAIYGVIGAPARASMASKQLLIDVARESLNAVMIVSEPFAVAYGVNRLTDAVIIDIGAGTVDICRLCGTFPGDEDQVTVPIGGDLIDEEFCRLVRAEHPDARLTPNMARQIKERCSSVCDDMEKVIVQFPANGRPRSFDVTGMLRDACRIIVQPIMQGIHQIISTCDPEFQSRMLSNVLLAGGGSQIKGLDKMIEEGLQEFGGGRVTRVHDPVFGGATGSLKLAMAMPKHYWQQMTQVKREPTSLKIEPRAAA